MGHLNRNQATPENRGGENRNRESSKSAGKGVSTMAMRSRLGLGAVLALALSGLPACVYSEEKGGADAALAQKAEDPSLSDLTEDEKNTIEVFNKVSKSAVFVEEEHVNERGEVKSSMGSGVVWDAQGHIVTNAHVVKGGTQFNVSFYDNPCEKVKVQLVGVDEATDLAVLRVDPKGLSLSPIKVFESDKLRAGQKVIVVGNPYGLRHTLSTGVISSTDRVSRTTNNMVRGMIQTDAVITYGNSGGPMVDSRGRLIGISERLEGSHEADRPGPYFGFAIPIQTVRLIIPQLIEKGKLTRGALNLTFENSTPQNGVSGCGDKGVVVRAVKEGGAAARAGIRPGDVIRKIRSDVVADEETLRLSMNRYKPDETVNVTVLRGKEELEFNVILDEMPNQ